MVTPVQRGKGFTLIELLVVLAIVALLLSIVAPRMMQQTDKAAETALKQNLASLRMAIDRYQADTGAYPKNLQALVEAKYLRMIPQDPVSGRNDSWIIVGISENGEQHVFDIHSGAPGQSRDGSAYSGW